MRKSHGNLRNKITVRRLVDKPAYTVAEVAATLGLSARHVRRIFLDEKGVILIDRPETLRKQRYRTLRIPRAVYQRVLERLSK